METQRIFEILDNFEEDLDENLLLEELKKIYEEEIKCSFQGPEKNNENIEPNIEKNNVKINLFAM